MYGNKQKSTSPSREGRRSNDKENFIDSNLMCQCEVRRLCIYWAVYAISRETFILNGGK